MKKIVFALVVLLFAAPTWAVVDITAVVGECEANTVVTISFDASSEDPDLVRAFGLNIQCDNDANILEVTGINPDYYIYPGTIQINAAGEVTYQGTIAAEYGDLPSDTLPGPPDGNGVTIECASLYAPVGPGSPNAPAASGDLLTFRVDKTCNVTITANVSRAGATGVVMEDPDDDPTVNFPATFLVEVCVGPDECYTGPQIDEWRSVGSPDCWCASVNPRQCHGDSVGDAQGRYNYWVGTNDLAVFVAAWNKSFADIEGQVEPISGTPLICADCDHLPEGRYAYRVSANDLGIFVANWNQANSPDADCP